MASASDVHSNGRSVSQLQTPMKLRNGLWTLFLAATTLAAADNLLLPTPGRLRQKDQSICILYGMHANFVRGERVFEPAQAASFANRFGVVYSNSRLLLLSNTLKILGSLTVSGDSGIPVLASGATAEAAVAWFPANHELAYWTPSGFRAVEIQLSSVTSVRRFDAKTAELLSGQAGEAVTRTRLSLMDGSVVSQEVLPGLRAPAVFWKEQILSYNSPSLLLGAADGSRQQTIPLDAADFTAESISDEWLHVSSASEHRDWALHLTKQGVEVSELPAEVTP